MNILILNGSPKGAKSNTIKLTAFAVPAVAIYALVSGNSGLATAAGYLIFGLMWLISAFTKEPLCAAYVKYNYGGDKALENPVFVTPNRILAAAWGVLYVILAPLTLIMQNAGLSVLSIIVCNAAPILMGIFTAWFENWYPAHVARG